MKGAEAYVNDQWEACGLSQLPQISSAQRITLHFIIPRSDQFTGMLEDISAICRRHLQAAYPGREVHAEPIVGSVVGDGSGDGITLGFDIGSEQLR